MMGVRRNRGNRIAHIMTAVKAFVQTQRLHADLSFLKRLENSETNSSMPFWKHVLMASGNKPGCACLTAITEGLAPVAPVAQLSFAVESP